MAEVISIKWQIIMLALAVGIAIGLGVGYIGDYHNTNVSTSDTTIGEESQNSCPDTLPLTCPETYSTTPSTTIEGTTTTTYIPIQPLPVYASGGDYYTTSPTRIDPKWQFCNPYENVSVPVDHIIRLSNQTYNMTYLNGTTEVINRSSEIKYKTIKGGCITASANCCRVEDGGTATPINAKLYSKYYEEVLGGCDDKPIVCPMIMRSAIGTHPAVACLEGRCQIVNR